MKINVYLKALEYLKVAATAEKNGFTTAKTKKAISWIDEIQQRSLNPEKYRQDKFYRASKEINDLVCLTRNYFDRVKIYLENLDLESEYPCKILYENIITDEIYYVETELLYEDDSREEMKYFSYKSKTYKEFAKELDEKYSAHGIRVLFIDGPYIRKSTTYKWMGLHTFNEDTEGGE